MMMLALAPVEGWLGGPSTAIGHVTAGGSRMRRHGSAQCAAVRHFINLSNGAEALPLIEKAGLRPEDVAFCRVQSSHCEAQDFNAVLANLDHNLLMHLALGFECRVYDFGSRGNYWAVEEAASDAPSSSASPEPTAELQYVPRALWWGLEWSRYALNTLWHLEVGTPLLRGYNVQSLFDEQLRAIPKPLWKRLKYYRAYTATGLQEIRLRGYYAQTLLDGNKEAYRDFMLAHATRSEDAQGVAIDPAEFAVSMRSYDASTAKRLGEMRGRR